MTLLAPPQARLVAHNDVIALTTRLVMPRSRKPGTTTTTLLPLPLSTEFSKDKLTAALQGGDAAFTVVPGARQVKGAMPAEPDVMVRRLAASLVPLADQYPLPFYKLEG